MYIIINTSLPQKWRTPTDVKDVSEPGFAHTSVETLGTSLPVETSYSGVITLDTGK